MNTSKIATSLPQVGDVIEVVVRGRVSGVQVDGVDEPIVYFQHDGDGSFEYNGYAPPVYLNNHVQALTVITPARRRLNLNDLPIGTVVEGLNSGETTGIYRLVQQGDELVAWACLDGRDYSAADLYGRHDELVELVRKDALA